MTRRLLTHAEVKAGAVASRVAKHAKQAKAKPKTNYVTAGGRHSNPEKLAWLRTKKCLVAENTHWAPVVSGVVWVSEQSRCVGRVEPHHHRVRGARANDARTVPICASHHRTAPDSLHVLGRRGFEAFHRLDLDAECGRYETEWQARTS